MIPKEIRLLMFEVAEAILERSDIELEFFPEGDYDNAGGIFLSDRFPSRDHPIIGINADMSEGYAFGTFCHELGHALDDRKRTKPETSVEALVLQHGQETIDKAEVIARDKLETEADKWRDCFLMMTDPFPEVKGKLKYLLSWANKK